LGKNVTDIIINFLLYTIMKKNYSNQNPSKVVIVPKPPKPKSDTVKTNPEDRNLTKEELSELKREAEPITPKNTTAPKK